MKKCGGYTGEADGGKVYGKLRVEVYVALPVGWNAAGVQRGILNLKAKADSTSEGYSANNARLHSQSCWCPYNDSSDETQWIEVDLKSAQPVVGVAT
eukprot:CAMPEP_0185755764 /NCGR_PEP_ID=MMETSP1174-20130828/14236_1 /TAXON_ID=35687 /ORGANISM="Dictyocha speculum, Strain CCMP1381" /LENGTH=96 /DNA_ID=CAMNT_0028434435 /DNA_START=13 /DNA_END=300 /DNA_ORIENTATION=-